MRIPVEYFDGSFDFVEPDRLDKLIRFRRIVRFQRSDGWVRPDRDPIRKPNGKNYCGTERREQHS